LREGKGGWKEGTRQTGTEKSLRKKCGEWDLIPLKNDWAKFQKKRVTISKGGKK